MSAGGSRATETAPWETFADGTATMPRPAPPQRRRPPPRRSSPRDTEPDLWLLPLLDGWRRAARVERRGRALVGRALRRRERLRLDLCFRGWVADHTRRWRHAVEQRMQRQAEARAAAEGRALVRAHQPNGTQPLL